MLRKKPHHKTISFYKIIDVLDEYRPVPAKKLVPEWYRNTQSYTEGEKKPDGQGGTTATIKKCIPVFDAITAGYIIVTHTDLFVSRKSVPVDNQNTIKDGPWYEWASYGAITFHGNQQAPLHPNNQGFSYPKFENPWAIKTAKGYSTLFIPPVHRSTPFNILPGMVDTDSYTKAVNFPFVLSDPNFEGLIPAGTPVAQVIPVKRDTWVSEWQTEEHRNSLESVDKKLHIFFFDKYKNNWWQRKDYR